MTNEDIDDIQQYCHEQRCDNETGSRAQAQWVIAEVLCEIARRLPEPK